MAREKLVQIGAKYREIWHHVNDAQTKSDAVVCAQLCPICPARGWGVVWLVISMGFWAGGVCYLVLHVGGHLKP